MSQLEHQVEQILVAIEELHKVAGDGPATRKLLDSLFRTVHSLKASASANGQHDLAAAAHELENILHSLRSGEGTFDEDFIPAEMRSGLTQTEKHSLSRAVEEGANLFLVQTMFDLDAFDQQFQSLKDKLNQNGEVISKAPTVDHDSPGKINFRILFARAGDVPEELSQVENVTIERLVTNSGNRSVQDDLETRAAELEQAVKSLSTELVTSRIDTVGSLLDQALRAGQAAALATGKQVDFAVSGENLILDATVCEGVSDPLVHLVRNAVDHGIEDSNERVLLGKNPRGTVVIEVATSDREARITISDDGRGIDPDYVSSIFKPGFSTASGVSEISGRGVGLDVVETRVKELGGSVRVDSKPGQGSTFEISLKIASRDE